MRDLTADLQWLEDHAPEAHPVREFLLRAMTAEQTIAEIQTILSNTTTPAETIERMREVLPR